MNKGSITQFVKGNTAHRFPKVVALAVSSCALVAMIAIDASASPNAVAATAGASAHARMLATQSRLHVFAVESSLGRPFGIGLPHPQTVDTPTTTATTTPPTTTTFAPVVVTSGTTSGATSGGGTGGGGTGGGGTGGGGGTQPTTTTTQPTTTTTQPTTTTTTPPSTPSVSGGLVTAGASRSQCLITTPSNAGQLSSVQAVVNSFQNATGSTVSCLGVYNTGGSAWSDWENPWVSGPAGAGYSQWVAEAPSSRQLVIGQDLIPSGLANINNPLGWEQSCAAGDFDSYATTFATNLVAAGLQNSVIRLGEEMNGSWEKDYVGTTTQEQNLWATCFANEVTAMRKAPGEHLLIDWDINACTSPIPYANYYPGNAYVDILGIDLYNASCDAPNTALSFSQLANETYGLTSFEAFAAAQGKPMSFPEWGLTTQPSGDNPAYITSMGSTINNGNFAFEEYFDVVDGDTMLLDAGNTPLSDAAFQKAFG
jgi:hypothetical protein